MFSREDVICNVGCNENEGNSCYKIQQLDRNSSFKVTNTAGQVVAEVSTYIILWIFVFIEIIWI